MTNVLTQFTPDEVELFWPKLDEMLDTIPHTWKHWTKSYIQTAVAQGVLQLWGVGPKPRAEFVFFTQIWVYPADKVLGVPWGAGQFKPEMLDLIEPALNSYAKYNDCGSIEIRGRPGWDPHFKAIGMSKEFITWSLPVLNMRIH